MPQNSIPYPTENITSSALNAHHLSLTWEPNIVVAQATKANRLGNYGDRHTTLAIKMFKTDSQLSNPRQTSSHIDVLMQVSGADSKCRKH